MKKLLISILLGVTMVGVVGCTSDTPKTNNSQEEIKVELPPSSKALRDSAIDDLEKYGLNSKEFTDKLREGVK